MCKSSWRRNALIAIAAAGILAAPTSASAQLYLDPNAPIHDRVVDLLGRMTVEEKASLLTATSYGVERLGIPKYYMGNECLHGVVRPGYFTVFPQAIGLAATWNPVLLRQVSTAISDEARAKWNELDQGKEQKDQFSDVLYPFGHGLSYTKYDYRNLRLSQDNDSVYVTFTLRNTGKRDGDEVAQVYVKLDNRPAPAPIKELRGFDRVSLKKGEKRDVTIALRKDLLRYWDEEADSWIYPDGECQVMVGPSSGDIRLSATTDITR